MPWQYDHRDRLCSAEEAVSIVEDGDRVIVPLTEQPMTLVRALAERAHEISDATLTVSVPQFDLPPVHRGGLERRDRELHRPAWQAVRKRGPRPVLAAPILTDFQSQRRAPGRSQAHGRGARRRRCPQQLGTAHVRTPVLVQARPRTAGAKGRPRGQSHAGPHLRRRLHAHRADRQARGSRAVAAEPRGTSRNSLRPSR